MPFDINDNAIILHKVQKKEILDNTDILGCKYKSALQKIRPKDSAY